MGKYNSSGAKYYYQKLRREQDREDWIKVKWCILIGVVGGPTWLLLMELINICF